MTKKLAGNCLDVLIRIVEFTLVLIILLDCNSVYRHNLGADIVHIDWSVGSACIAAFVLLLLHLINDNENIICVKDHASLFFLSFVFCMEFNAINSLTEIRSTFGAAQTSMIYGKYFLAFFLVFTNLMVVLFQIYKRRSDGLRLFFLLEHVILFIAVASLILWFGSSILELWGRNDDVYVFWGGKYYDSNYLNLCIRRTIFEGDLTKNLGIFVEPPMYGLMLGYGLYTELFMKKKSNVGIVAIFILALLSCRAILPIMVAMLAFFFLIYEKIREKKNARIIMFISVCVMLVAAVALVAYKSRVGMGSLATHVDDYVASIKCWLHFPIFGCGFDFPNPIYAYFSDFRADNLGLSNSAGVVLAEGGILLFAYYLLPFSLMAFAYFRKNRRLAYWALGMFAFWVVVIFHARLFVFFIMAFGFSMINLKLHLFSKQKGEKEEKKKYVELSVRFFEDEANDSDETFVRNVLNLPRSLVLLTGVAVFFFATWGLMHAKLFSVFNLATCVLIILTEITVLAINVIKKSISKQKNAIIQLILIITFMTIGQPYQVLHHFYKATGLLIQDNWWLSIVVAIGTYGIGVITDKMMDNAFSK